MSRLLRWFDLKLVEYADGLELQRQFQEGRRQGLVPDTLLLLEHPPVLTLGRGASAANILHPADELERLGVSVVETDRGGDVTYHGPGQLVGYPLLHLEPGRQDVRRYVRDLEEVIIRTLADFGLTGARMPRWPGVWVPESRLGGPRKVCALGVHLSRWYTRHGFALNVDPQLEHFALIVPCGIREAGVTSLRAELDRPVDVDAVRARLVHHFSTVFEAAAEPGDPVAETVSVAVVRDGPIPRVLLLKRTPERGGFWQLITGKVEPGESPAQAAARELVEETGLPGPVRPLDYVHSFAWGESLPPRLARESAFVTVIQERAQVQLDPREHQALEWVELGPALQRLPFAGLREAVRRALGPRAHL